jgi:pilus assembly protein CpaF
VRLEARPASLEGRGEVTIRRLVRNALRMRPDRIVVGEVRGAEALDMLGAMSTGHDGSLSTVHAGSAPRRCGAWRPSRSWPTSRCRTPRCASRSPAAIDLVVHQARMPDGSRRVVSVCEVDRVDGAPRAREVYAAP